MCLNEHLGLRFKWAKLGWLIGGLVCLSVKFWAEEHGSMGYLCGIKRVGFEWLNWRGSDDWWA